MYYISGNKKVFRMKERSYCHTKQKTVMSKGC